MISPDAVPPGRCAAAMMHPSHVVWRLPLAAGGAGAWHHVEVAAARPGAGAILYVELRDRSGAVMGDPLYLTEQAPRLRGRDGWDVLCFIPPEAAELQLRAIGREAGTLRAEPATLRPVGRARAALELALRAPRGSLATLLRQPGGLRPEGLARRFRARLVVANRDLHTVPQDYDLWCRMFDSWTAEALPPASEDEIGYLVLAQAPGTPALEATVASLAAQFGGAPRSAVLLPGAALPALGTRYTGLLQAGEVLPPQATRLAALRLAAAGHPGIVIADEDALDASGRCHSPLFKPTPGPVAMLNGTLARGLWLVESGLVQRHAPATTDGWAEALRLGLFLACHRAEPDGASLRLPFILAHRRADAEAAPPTLLAAVAERYLAQGGPAIAPLADHWPLRFRLRTGGPAGKVTAIVPSTLRPAHARRCIEAVLRDTDYPTLELRLAVMQAGPLDPAQEAVADAITRDPRARLSLLPVPRFNFSTVNNHVAAETEGEFVLLLNDDVSPIRPDWLRWMVAYMADPQVAMVGARLLYPSGAVQHGGVIMGMTGLCDHAHRNLPRAEPGYLHRAVTAQELSVVTAACMLVRRSVYEKVGGLDPAYPSAFNDVDFSLRVREAGHSVVYAAQAELFHHESQTYGDHYAGDRQGFHEEEVARMRRRWPEVIAADPFHNPNLSLTNGHEWDFAFPPRVAAR